MSAKHATIVVRSSSTGVVIFPAKFAAAVSQVYRDDHKDDNTQASVRSASPISGDQKKEKC